VDENPNPESWNSEGLRAKRCPVPFLEGAGVRQRGYPGHERVSVGVVSEDGAPLQSSRPRAITW
jgi:hypothetical protein